MSPTEPRELRAVRAENRRRVEVVSALERRFGAGLDVDRDQRIDRIDDVAVRALLPDRDQSIASGIDANVRKQARRVGRDLRGRGAGSLSIDLIVAEIDEIDDAVMNRIGTTAVTVDLRPCVERGGRDVPDCPIGGTGDDDVAAFFERPALDPIDIVAVNSRLRQRYGLGYHRVGGDGRAPRSEAAVICHWGLSLGFYLGQLTH